MSLNIDNIGIPYTTSNGVMSINLQSLVAKTTMGFFSIKNTNGNYGLSQEEVDDILKKPKDKQINDFLEKKGIPKISDPGITTLLNKFAEMIADAIAQFGSYFITLANTIGSLTELLKNPTNPENVTKIEDSVSGLKELIKSVTKFFTDTVTWMQETFMGPLVDVKIPSPAFLYQMVEHIPAFPFTIPIPPLNTSLEGTGADKIDLTKLEPRDFTKAQILFNTPYLYQVPNTNKLVEEFNMSPDNTELTAQQLKTTQMIKNIVSFPVKILIGFINKLISAITGAISFNFSEFKDLIKMMIPTLPGIIKLFGSIVDGIIPNFSKTFEQMDFFIKNENLNFTKSEDINKLTEFTKNININNKDVTSEFDQKINDKFENLDKNINNIINKKNEFYKLNKNQLENFLKFLRDSEEGIQKNFKEINKLSSDLFLPDYVMMNTNYTEPIFNLIGTTNKIDFHTYSQRGEIIYPQGHPIENKILKFYSNTTENIREIYDYLNINIDNLTTASETNINILSPDGPTQITPPDVINTFFKQFEGSNLPQETLHSEILDFLNKSKSFLLIENQNIINNYFIKYDKSTLNHLKVTTEDTIRYVENIEEIKKQTREALNVDILITTKNLITQTLDLKSNKNPLPLYQIENDLIDELKNNTLELENLLENSYIAYLTVGTNINIKQKLSNIINYMYDDYNNFKHYEHHISTTGYTQFEYTLDNAESIIQLCNELIEVSFDELFLVTNFTIFEEILELNLGTSSTYIKENIILRYLNMFKNTLESNLNFIIEDENNQNVQYINTLIMINTSILNNVGKIENNTENLKKDFKTKAKTTLDHLKKMSTTPPPTDKMGTYSLSFINIMENFPQMLLNILKSIFEFVLKFLPF